MSVSLDSKSPKYSCLCFKMLNTIPVNILYLAAKSLWDKQSSESIINSNFLLEVNQHAVILFNVASC
jgi:hypothetical protein